MQMLAYRAQNKRDLTGVDGGSSTAMRKKIKNFSYHKDDKLGKGFSSVVYKGKNDDTGIHCDYSR